MNIRKVIATVSLAFIAQVGWAAPEEWPVSAGGTGHHFEAILVTGGITWLTAAADATDRGGYLATITSGAENEFIFDLIKSVPAFWIPDGVNAAGPWLGGFQPPGSGEPAGGWTWVTGEPWSYTRWASAEPDNLHGTEDRLHYFDKGIQSQPTWNDVPGNYLLPGYILEIPEPSSLALLATVIGAVMLRPRRSGVDLRETPTTQGV